MEDKAIERERTSYPNTAEQTAKMPHRLERQRRSSRKPRRILRLSTRYTIAALCLVLLVLATISLVAKGIRPYRESGIQVRQLAQTKQQIAEIDRENAALRRQVNYLKTSKGIVTEARQAGYLKPGEIPFVVEGASVPPNGVTDGAADAPASHPAGSRFSRLWHEFVGH